MENVGANKTEDWLTSRKSLKGMENKWEKIWSEAYGWAEEEGLVFNRKKGYIYIPEKKRAEGLK